jgi:hypothetical protein
VVVSGKPKLQPRKSGETEESIRNMERQNIPSAGKIDAGTSSRRQQPSEMEGFRGQGVLRAEFGEKGKERINPIKSERHVVHACPHLTKTCSLSSETLQTNPLSRKKFKSDKKL